MNHQQETPSPHIPNFPIVIIGTGFAGIGMAIQLKKAGILSFSMFERDAEVGGTWRDNTYPGCACDVPSHVYSFSFEPNPNWNRAFAPFDEIQQYLLDCVEKYRLREHMRFNTEITSARFDEDAGLWQLLTSTGESLSARFVVSGVGGLVDPAYPDIKGMEKFTGEMFHTARWNHDCDLRGKDVAVIGTGASAIQAIPAIAARVGKLSVFQRTPHWIMPRLDRAFSESRKRFFSRHSLWHKLYRWLLFWLSEVMGPIVFLNSPLSKIGEMGSRLHLKHCMKDPELRKKLTPDFQFGCKRVLISDDYWPIFSRDNVELVTDGIAQITEEGIETVDGRLHPADVIVLATGFALGLANAPFSITGLGGRTLDEVWKDGAVAYKGVTVHGFPNWFIMMGPNTGPGHTSVLVYTERQIDYALQAIQKIIGMDLKHVDVHQEVQDRYNERIQKRMKYTAWTSGCNSWYLNPDGSNHALFPGFASEYCLSIRKFEPAEYDLVRF
ncbi:MAG: NAD(P)/FAD-dependent oxidoreductase [Deltaproteobacteria bacterium]|nr:MAG: NAD(P)/FAD-dependent oxidoreductase [Deltaproteobacteria bacterium]